MFQVITPSTGKISALKRVKLDGVDPIIRAGYMNEVSLLNRIREIEGDVPVIRLCDWVCEGDILLMVS